LENIDGIGADYYKKVQSLLLSGKFKFEPNYSVLESHIENGTRIIDKAEIHSIGLVENI
jgi:hypothetical protein